MKIITTQPTKPPRLVLYGEHKIGKSSFAAASIKPIFIQTEDGLDQLHVQAFEQAKTFQDVIDAMRFLIETEHEFKTLVVDSLDWLERLLWDKVVADYNHFENASAKQIGDIPYGGGYKAALNFWRQFLRGLDLINQNKKMMVILLAHSKIVKFEDPTRQNYDRYDLDLHEKAAGLIYQWSDIIGFANEKIIVSEKKEGFGSTVKAKDTGTRMLNLNKRAAYEAGNRYNLPDMELDFGKFWEALKPSLISKKEEK